MKYLGVSEILRLHFQIINDFGGSHGVREPGRIESVCEAPKMQAFGVEQYATVHEKAAVYSRNIVADHPFMDGNKRTAITCAGVFLMRNGWRLTATSKQLEDFAVRVAVEKLDVAQIAAWLKQNTSN